MENPATKALRDGVVVGLANHTLLIRKDGTECPIDDSVAPIRNVRGEVSGCVLIFRDVTMQRQAGQEREAQLHGARLLAWRTWRTLQVPLVWILHAGYA